MKRDMPQLSKALILGSFMAWVALLSCSSGSIMGKPTGELQDPAEPEGATDTDSGRCVNTSDCPAGKVCDVAAQTCVQPLTPDEPTGCLNGCGPTIESFFDNSKVATLRITVDEDYMREANYEPEQWLDLLWDKWNSHCGPYEWVPVRMEYESPDGDGDDVLEQVAMRLRGKRSRGVNPLAGFKLDYDMLSEFENRRFADLNKLEALSNENDDTNMLQCISYQLMRDFGIEAPRCNHIHVYVNGSLYGLMENVERAKDGRFLRHHFGMNEGQLYACSTSCGYENSLADLEYYGDVFGEEYAAAYEILRGTLEEAETFLIPMFKCGDPEQTPDDEDFRECISEWLDVEQWLRLIAAESLTPTVEDFVGARRNYFMYFKPDANAPHGGRINIWGWDYDVSLQTATCYPRTCDPFTSVAAWYGPRGARAKLVLRLTTVFREEYCALARSFLEDVYDPEKVAQMAAVIEPFMEDDPVITAEVWRAEVDFMQSFMVQHKKEASAAIEAGCAQY